MSRLSKASGSVAFGSVASTSQEGPEEEAPASASNRTLNVTLLSSEWKSTKGGLSTVSRELAIQCAKHPNVEVSVYIPKCSEEDKKIAASHNVQLMEAQELPGYEAVDWLASVPENHAMDCIIGHGVPLGRQIPLIKRHNRHCKWIQIVHTAPEELGMYKTYADAIAKGEKKHQTEVRLCEMADQVVAVGPKLADAYSRSLRPCQKDQKVLTLTPGIFTEFSEVKQTTEEGNKFVVLVFGRGDSEDFELKGYDIAAKAIAELNDMSCHLMFVGAPSGKEEEVKEKLLGYSISPAQLTVRCFDESRERLAKLLCEVDLAIMPSRTEGFGLTALEALSAGLPLLVSGNSGLGEALKKVATGSNWIVASEEPKDWAKAICAVREKGRDIRLEECEILREKYGAKYSWQKQCYSLVEAMQKISFAFLGLRVECESVKQKEPSSQDEALDSANLARPKEGTKETATTCTAVTNDVAQTGVHMPRLDEILCLVALKRLQVVPPSSVQEFEDFIEFMSTVKGIITQDVRLGSLLITVKCRSLQVLEDLWTDYTSGLLNEIVQGCLVTDDVLNDLGLSELKLFTSMREADYKACKEILQDSDCTKHCFQLHAEAGQTAVVISYDSKQSKEPKNQRSKDKKTRTRRQRDGASSWYDKAVNTEYHEEVMPIPKGKAGLLIGRKGWRIKDIKEQSGVKELNIRDDQVHIRGTEEQCLNAEKIINMILKGEDSPDQGSWKKLDFIPKKHMGEVIRRISRELNNIEKNTGAALKVSKGNQTQSLYIKGSTESQMRAIRKIKEVVNLVRHLHSGKRTVQLVHVDTTQLDLNNEFHLSSTPLTCRSGAAIFEVRPIELRSQDMEDMSPGLTGIEKLRDKLLMVLNDIHKEKEEEKVMVDIWCHFGHAYITKVDEADQTEEYFTLGEIKNKLEEEKPDWMSIFKEGLKKIEVEHIEESLESRAVKEEIRYDFTFYTPTCRYVRVKVWLTGKDDGGQEGDETTSMAFSRSAPFSVMNVMSHVLPDGQGDSSNTPCFYMCSRSQKRMKVDILMPSKECDFQLFIKTCPVGLVPRTPRAEKEDKILESYLMGMKIKEGQLILPPVSERPDGFDLFYQRRSRRKIYEYEMDDERFTLLISKYQEKTVDAAETEGGGFEEIAAETDIHLHCKEWDRMLEEETWEPEQIVAKLPTFLQFMRSVQSSVAP